jgi:hypothetical protein
MKTIVPYNLLNGRITDAVIAGSDVQPTMQSPVLEVIGIPGSVSDILIMSNGSESDFRYSRFEAKKPTDDIWFLESDLQPVEGNPIVGNAFVLGRDEEDQPVAYDLENAQIISQRLVDRRDMPLILNFQFRPKCWLIYLKSIFDYCS